MNKTCLALGAVALGLASWLPPRGAAAQPPAGDPAPPAAAPNPDLLAALPPVRLFQLAQSQIAQGSFDVAAETLKRFLASNPKDEDYSALTKSDPTAVLKLRNVPVWSDEPAAQKSAKETVQRIIEASEAVNAKRYKDPERVALFVRNLGESSGERAYAEQQLRLSGDAVVAPLIDAMRNTTDSAYRAGLAGAVGRLNPDQLPGIFNASATLPTELRLAILRSAAARPDARALSASPDTDLMPHLWYYAGSRGDELRSLREFAAQTLNAWTNGESPKKSAPLELVNLATPLSAREGRFRGLERVKIFSAPTAEAPVTAVEVSRGEANDYYALRNVRWALERDPRNGKAQELFLATTIDRAVVANGFGNVLEASPDLLPAFAAAPSEMLVDLLDRALAEKKTALALGAAQILGSRADKVAMGSAADGRPGALQRALDYPDGRVQLAAAVGLLRVPGAVPASQTARVVEILRRAAGYEPPAPGAAEQGRALIADPSDFRAGRLGAFLRQAGYAPVRVSTGRQLASRLAASDDADLIFIDRHVVSPELADVVSGVRSNANANNRPVFVVASGDRVSPPGFDRLLLRLAMQVAASETSNIAVPNPFAFDPNRPLRPGEEPERRAQIAAERDSRLSELFELRLRRLRELVRGANLPNLSSLSTALDIRLPQLTYAALAAQYPVTQASSPKTLAALQSSSRTVLANEQLRNATRTLRADGLSRLVEELDAALSDKQREMVEAMLARADAPSLGVAGDDAAEPTLLNQLARLVRNSPGVRVIPEPAGVASLQGVISQGIDDPAKNPVPSAVRKQNARLALEYLRRMATGELPGYDVRPAAGAMRAALRDDDLADLAVDGVARLGTPEAQQDLLAVALGLGRPAALRQKAADRAIQHVQTFGRLTPPAQLEPLAKAAQIESTAEFRAKLAVLAQLLKASPATLSELIGRYPLPLPSAKPADADPAPKDAAPAPKPAEGGVKN